MDYPPADQTTPDPTEGTTQRTTSDAGLEGWDWRAALREDGRTITWLARRTGKAASTVYGYAYGAPIPAGWLELAAAAMGHVPAAR